MIIPFKRKERLGSSSIPQSLTWSYRKEEPDEEQYLFDLVRINRVCIYTIRCGAQDDDGPQTSLVFGYTSTRRAEGGKGNIYRRIFPDEQRLSIFASGSSSTCFLSLTTLLLVLAIFLLIFLHVCLLQSGGKTRIPE